jgi:YHS domain-containing protein
MTPHPVRPARVVSVSLFALAALGGLFPALARSDEPESIAWRSDYGAALGEARAANRFLWIQFTGPWCPNCVRMERDSFPHAAVVEHSQTSFLPVQLRSDLNEQLATALGLSAIPATIIVAPNRDVIGFHQGYLGPLELDALMRDCLARHPLEPTQEARAGSSDSKPQNKNAQQSVPKAEPELAMGGYCTVSLIDDRKLVKGRVEHSILHEGRTYRFGSTAASERFRQEPARYLPFCEGKCPVTRVEEGISKPGEPRWGALYAGRLFVFASEQNRRLFLENPDAYAQVECRNHDGASTASAADSKKSR